MPRRTYRAVALDVGGVIYYDEPFELAWIQYAHERLRAAGIAGTGAEFAATLKAHLASRRNGQPTVFDSLVVRGSWLQVRQRWASLAQPIPGAVQAVRDLATCFDIHLVANQPPECLDALEQLGLGDYRSRATLDSLVGYAKPDPRLLTTALAHSHHPASDVLVVGNRMDHDITPAQHLGHPTALIRQHDGWRPPPGVDPAIASAYRISRAEQVDVPHSCAPSHTAATLWDLNCTLLTSAQPQEATRA